MLCQVKTKLFCFLFSFQPPNVSAVNILFTNTTVQVQSPDTDFFEIMTGVLQGDTLAPYLFIIVLDYSLRLATDDEQIMDYLLSKAKNR